MKKLFLSLIAFFSFIAVYSQSGVDYKEIVVGRNHITGQAIYAGEYTFPEKIYDSVIDVDSALLTIQLRGTDKKGKHLKKKGSIELYDLRNKQVKWRTKVQYDKEKYIIHKDQLVKHVNNNSVLINRMSGDNAWRASGNLFYLDDERGKGILSKYGSNRFEGYDLKTGKSIWKRKLKTQYGWKSINLNDSTLLVCSSGLYTVNINDGMGWDYEAVTYDKDYTGTVVANAVGLGLGLLTGTFFMSIGYDLVNGISSNALIDDENDRIYMASKKELTCLDKDGTTVWDIPLPENLMSHSELLIEGDILYLFNFAYAYRGDTTIPYGTPAVGLFYKKTGEQYYFNIVGEKENPYFDYMIDWEKGLIYLMYEHNIAIHSLKDGAFVVNKSFKFETDESMQAFENRALYLMTDSVFHPVTSVEDATLSVITEKNTLFLLKDNLDTVRQIKSDQLYYPYLETDSYILLGNSDHVIWIDRNGLVVGNMENTGALDLLGNYLYGIRGNRLIEIDIRQFTE